MVREQAWQQADAVRWYLDSVRAAAPLTSEQLAVMLRMIAQGRHPVARFLDVGAGDGFLSAVLLAEHPEAEATLVDFSEPMLDAARERLAGHAAAPALIDADLATPAWRDAVIARGPFDAIISGFAIHHLEDRRKRALYAELFDLLDAGGTFAHIEHVAPGAPWVTEAFDEAIVDAVWAYERRANPALTREQTAAAYFAWPDHEANILAPLEAQCQWLEEAGFVGVTAPFRWYEIAVFGGYHPG